MTKQTVTGTLILTTLSRPGQLGRRPPITAIALSQLAGTLGR